MSATHNVCGATIYRVWVNAPGGSPVIGYFLICAQCNQPVTVAEVTGTPTDDAVSTNTGS